VRASRSAGGRRKFKKNSSHLSLWFEICFSCLPTLLPRSLGLDLPSQCKFTLWLLSYIVALPQVYYWQTTRIWSKQMNEFLPCQFSSTTTRLSSLRVPSEGGRKAVEPHLGCHISCQLTAVVCK
jgi:hypothetical protein